MCLAGVPEHGDPVTDCCWAGDSQPLALSLTARRAPHGARPRPEPYPTSPDADARCRSASPGRAHRTQPGPTQVPDAGLQVLVELKSAVAALHPEKASFHPLLPTRPRHDPTAVYTFHLVPLPPPAKEAGEIAQPHPNQRISSSHRSSPTTVNLRSAATGGAAGQAGPC